MKDKIFAIIDRFYSGKHGSKADFARKVGVHPVLAGNWLSGKASPGAGYRRKICEAYGISRDWLDTGTGPMLRETAQDSGKRPAPTETSAPAPAQSEALIEARTEAEVWKAAFVLRDTTHLCIA